MKKLLQYLLPTSEKDMNRLTKRLAVITDYFFIIIIIYCAILYYSGGGSRGSGPIMGPYKHYACEEDIEMEKKK